MQSWRYICKKYHIAVLLLNFAKIFSMVYVYSILKIDKSYFVVRNKKIQINCKMWKVNSLFEMQAQINPGTEPNKLDINKLANKIICLCKLLHFLATLKLSVMDKIVLIKCQKRAGHVKENIKRTSMGSFIYYFFANQNWIYWNKIKSILKKAVMNLNDRIRLQLSCF